MLVGYKNLRGIVSDGDNPTGNWLYAQVDEVHVYLWGLLTSTKTVTVYKQPNDSRWRQADNSFTKGYDVERMFFQLVSDDKALRELMASPQEDAVGEGLV